MTNREKYYPQWRDDGRTDKELFEEELYDAVVERSCEACPARCFCESENCESNYCSGSYIEWLGQEADDDGN